MKQWEWIGVTLIREKQIAKKKCIQEKKMIFEGVTFSQPYGEIVSVIEDKEAVREQFQLLLLGKVVPTDGMILGYSETAVALSITALTLTQKTGRGYCQSYFHSIGLSEKLRLEKVEACLAFSELNDRFNEPITDYSTVEKAQLLASISLHSDTELICLDEYIVWVSSSFLVKVMTRVQRLKEKGVSIWLFTDQLTKVAPYCDRVLWIEFGRLRDSGPPKELQGRYEDHLMSLHNMTLEAQQAYWENGTIGQIQIVEETPPIPVAIEETAMVEAPILSESRQQRRQSSGISHQKHWRKQVWGLAASMIIVATMSIALVVRRIDVKPMLEANTKSDFLVNDVQTSSSLTLRNPNPTSPNSSVAQQIETSSFAESSEVILPIESLPAASFTHLVLSGESLSSLATRYGVSVLELMKVNGLADETILAGTSLSLPTSAKKVTDTEPSQSLDSNFSVSEPPATSEQLKTASYTVAKGDTLYRIAHQYGKSVLDLQEANGLQTPDLSLGQTLIIPE